VSRLFSLFLFVKEDYETIINTLKKDAFPKKLKKKQKEDTAILMIETSEVCQNRFSERHAEKY